MHPAEHLKREVKALVFDQYGTIVDMQKGLHALILVVLFVTGFTLRAHAHSWYPKECCSNRDCMPADGFATDARGDMQVIVGNRRIWVPRGFAVRPSRDERMHICFHLDDFEFQMPLCVFMPAQS